MTTQVLFRTDRETKEAFKLKAQRDGVSMDHILNVFVRTYIEKPDIIQTYIDEEAFDQMLVRAWSDPKIFSLVRKYDVGLSKNLFVIKEFGNYFILKGYLGGKSVRLIVAKRKSNIYIPLALYKKESKMGWNIRDDFDPSGHIARMERCIERDEFETFSLG